MTNEEDWPCENRKWASLYLRKKAAKFEYFANLYCSLVLFDVLDHYHHVWMKIVLKTHLYRDFSDFGPLTTFLDQIKEYADLRKFDN